MGGGEAIAPSSIIDMISRAVPASERASAVSFAFSGAHLTFTSIPRTFVAAWHVALAWLVWGVMPSPSAMHLIEQLRLCT